MAGAPSKRKSLSEPESDSWQSDENIEKEYDFGGRSEVTKPGSAKRRRISSNTAGTKRATKVTQGKRKGTGKKQQNLGLLLTMPLDILFAICGMLSPRDLVNLSRVDAKFCRTLTAHDASFLWKAVRKAEGGIEPARGIPEYRWVDLLFGKPVCDICHIKNAFVDWILRRRVCTQCSKANLIAASRVRRRFPGVDDDILNLIPLTTAGPGRLCSRKGYYWISDITEIQAKIKELEADPGFSKYLAVFRMERKKLVDVVTKDAKRCEEWSCVNARREADESGCRRDERFFRIKTHLLELGYDERDVQGIRLESSVVRDAELTSQGWNRSRRGLEAVIKKNRVQQAKADRTTALFSRAEIVKGILNMYKQQFLPVVWREVPSFADVCTFPAFRVVLEAPTELVVTDASFVDAMQQLPTLIADWKCRKESELRAQVASLKTEGVDPLKLATAVFSCEHQCNAIITNTDLWRHQCVPYLIRGPGSMHDQFPAADVDDLYKHIGNTTLVFDRTRSAIAASLVRLASCDPVTTTAEEMDDLNLRFLSTHDLVGEYCSVLGPTVYGPPILTWRECGNISPHSAGTEFDFRLLTPEDEAKKKRVYGNALDFSGSLEFFHCQHCSNHVDPQSYEDVSKHVQDVHDVVDPQLDRDLFLAPGEILPVAQRPPLSIVEFEGEEMDPWSAEDYS
ncbi:uncharacterized protein EV420DRAFT_1645547 [Desarmillaria tabescens]|uniref:F-box domain-containing protein n=1 Tax=Armillaria tabescens TaxID=1929756 RepID=A0AA39N0J2_ARMTA|nr:uncharacterized protein EV420DRAFT_1645547 [Desarmillaria tabescens]KAK0453018.1 hypothetical protein EV420DRAFT_1645547 [Desarmillaria tabescens]